MTQRAPSGSVTATQSPRSGSPDAYMWTRGHKAGPEWPSCGGSPVGKEWRPHVPNRLLRGAPCGPKDAPARRRGPLPLGTSPRPRPRVRWLASYPPGCDPHAHGPPKKICLLCCRSESVRRGRNSPVEVIEEGQQVERQLAPGLLLTVTQGVCVHDRGRVVGQLGTVCRTVKVPAEKRTRRPWPRGWAGM